MKGCNANALTKQQKKAALKYLMFLKQKRCGRIKGRGCADGCKQWLYKMKEETSSPTITIKALFLTCLVDAMEDRYVITCNIPKAFMQADINKLTHVKLEGKLAQILIWIDPTYQQYVTIKNVKPVIYAELTKALYGMFRQPYYFGRNCLLFLRNKALRQTPTTSV